MSDAIDNATAGQTIRCTITAEPRRQNTRDTIERLMRKDPEVKRGLRRSQLLRSRRNNVYVRGNRWWTSREKCGKIVRVEVGNTWTMPFTHDIAPDLRSIEKFVKIENA